MTRHDTIIQLIRWLPEAIDNGGGGIGPWIHSGPDSKLLTFGPLFHDGCPKGCDGTRTSCASPFPELLRCLTLLTAQHPLQHDHLTWRYWGGYKARQPVRVTRRRHDFTPTGLHDHQEVLVYGPASKQSRNVLDCVVYTWPPWVHQPEVDKAINHLSDAYRGTPFLPKAIIAA